MYSSRLNRTAEKALTKRLVWAITGIVGILTLIWFFGLKLLIGFSVLVGTIKGNPKPATNTQQVFVPPPMLSEIPEATNSATINLTGSAQEKSTVIIYVNNIESKKVTVGDDGIFTVNDLPISDGINSIIAKTINEKGISSDNSNQLSVNMTAKKPKLDVTNPSGDSVTVNGDINTFTITGTTDSNNSLIVNDRIAVVNPNGTFSYTLSLTSGDNKITIVARDDAGNETKAEKTITYHP